MSEVEIDGSQGEGGGQMLRTAVALSALTGRSVTVKNIRAKRANPGLAAQHLTAVRGVAALCSARIDGDRVGSTALSFEPGPVSGRRLRLDIGTAGSVTLVLQSCMLASLRANGTVSLRVTGGTNVRWSPPIDYFSMVLLPHLARMGVSAQLRLVQRGFHPQGGGEVDMELRPPMDMAAFDETGRGRLVSADGVCYSRNLPGHVCSRMSAAAQKRFLDASLSIASDVGEGPSSGAGMQLCARFERTLLGGDGLGERGVPAGKVGETAADALLSEIRSAATLDVHASDQLLPYMALADGPSRFIVREITGHLTTQMQLLRAFMPVEFETSDSEGGVLVRVVPTRT